MNDEANYVTPVELRDIAELADALTRVADDQIREVTFDQVPLHDSNGESLGFLVYRPSGYTFVTGLDHEGE